MTGYYTMQIYVYILVIVMFAGAKSSCLNNCTIFIDRSANCDTPLCSSNNTNSCEFIYTSLPHALMDLDMLCSRGSVAIHLMGGEYVIGKYAYGINVSKDIIIQGQGDTIINCGSIGDDPHITNLLLFYNSTTVELNSLEFTNCQRPIRFHNISKLTILQSSFRYFSNGVVDVLNARSFVISGSKFLNSNTPSENGSIRADSGGLVLRYLQSDINDFNAYVYNCFFINGTAGRRLDVETILTTLLATGVNSGLNQNQFIGRGGGMAVYINAVNSSVIVNVRNCTFENNYAEFFGGGLYLYTGGRSSNHTVLVEDTDFINNSVAAAGGAVQMALLIQNRDVSGSQYNYTNCSFISNSADYGGAVSAIQTYVFGRGNIVNMKGCNFEENLSYEKGSAITFASLLYPENVEEPYSYSITDCNFTNNSDPGGIVNLGFNNAEFHGFNRFENNEGPSLRIVGSLIKVFGRIVFRNNDATSTVGGSVYISEFGQLQVTEGTTIDFIGNKGEVSAGIFVDLEASPVPYLKLVRNVQCFIIHGNSDLIPNEWKNVNISFSENKARLGVAMFATSLDLCSWQQDSNFSTSAVVNSSSFHYGVNNNTAEVSKGSPNYVQTLASKITFNGSMQQSLSVRPGQNFRLYVEPTDEFDLITFAVMRFTDVKDNARPQSFNPSSVTGPSIQRDPTAIDLIDVDPSLSPFFPSEGYVNLTFGLPNFPTEFVEPSIIRDTKVLIEMPFNTKNVEIAGFNLTVLPCQAGFVLKRQSNGLVQCDCSYGSHFWFGNQIISCNKDTEEIILMDGYWSISVKRERYHLENYPCPVPYCKCLKSGQDCFNYYNHSDANGQCHPSRTGILCGSCVNNTGVGVLSLTCLENCRPYVGAISIVVLVLWNVILAILFLCLSHNFPPEFKGILFYIQIVPYATEYFPISVWQHKQYMLYFSNFLSFYFPIDFCLFPNVDALTIYAIGYIPLTVIIATQLITIRIMVTFNQSRRFLRKSAVWNGLWTWILLVYSRYLYESTNLLNCFNIGNEGIRWFRDGTVKCFQTPGHVFLALLAIAVLIVGLAIIPLIFLVVYKKIKTRAATLHMYKPLTHGYKESAKWWAAVDLFRRFIIILVIVVLPGRTLIPAGIMFLIFLMHVYFQPYQTKWHNWLEMYILLHFAVMLLLRSTAALVEELTDYNGIMVPVTEHSRDSITAWPQDDTATIFFLILIYFPLLLGMVYSLYCLIAYITLKIKRCFKKMSKTLKEKTTNTDSIVLHKYVEMKETTERKAITVSYA